jgi:hypothetical protein
LSTRRNIASSWRTTSFRTGIDVADAAKARGMKALIITGYGLRLCQLGGFDRHDFILKPIRPGALIELIANYLSRPSA